MTTRSRTRMLSAVLSAVLGLFSVLTSVTPASAAGGYTNPTIVENAPIIPDVAVEYHGLLYVTGGSADISLAYRLYSFDGTSFALIDSPYRLFTNISVVGDLLYFSAQEGDTWYLLSYDGTTMNRVGVESTLAPISYVGFGDGVVASVPVSGSEYHVDYVVGGTSNTMGVFDFANDFEVFDGFVYFTATPYGGTGTQLDRTDGVVLQEDVAPAGASLFAWKDALYMGNIYDSWTFTKMSSDLATEPGAIPAINYAFFFFDGGETMYFSGARDDAFSVFSYDGTTASALSGGPTNVGKMLMFDGLLWATDVHSSPTACATNIIVKCTYDYADVYYFDGTNWVLVTQSRMSTGFFVAFQNRVYLQDAGTWTYIERATLADTGIELAPMMWGALLAIVAGGAVLVIRRRSGHRFRFTTNG